MKPTRFRIVFFALAALLVAAILTIASAPQSVFPDISLARVEIFANAGDLPSENVRTEVAVPLETALANLPGLRTTRSYSDPGNLELELDFDPKTNSQDDLRAVRAIVDDVRIRLPVSAVTTLIEGPEAEPVVTYAITSATVRQADLARDVQDAVLPVFGASPGAGRVTVFAGPRVAYDVTIDAKKLSAHGLRARDVANAIAVASETHIAGSISETKDQTMQGKIVPAGERLRVISGGEITDAASLGSVRVEGPRPHDTILLHALARIARGEEPSGRQASFDAVHAVLLNVYPVAGGDAVSLKREIEARMPAFAAALPGDAKIQIAWDQTRLIVASQDALRLEMALGALIALLVIAAFLRDRSLTIVAAIVLPVALVFTIFALVHVGLRLDLMTLGGLAIAIGLIIDEVIVVIEAISRGLDGAAEGPSRVAIGDAVRRIAKPLVASTAANLVVFLPLAFLGGVPGFFFRALAITLSLALVISIALSLFVVPALAEFFGVRASHVPARRPVERAYIGLLRSLLRRSWLLYGATLAIVAVSVVMLVRVPNNFLPDVDEGQFEVKYAIPPGASLDEADYLANRFEQTFLLDRAVAHVARLSGVDTNGYVATPPDAGTIRVTVKPGTRDSFDAIADRMRDEVGDVNGYTAVEVHQLLEDQINDLSGAPEPIQIAVTGPSQDELTKIAAPVADAVAAAPGVVDTFDGVTWEPRSLFAEPLPGNPVSPDAFADDLRARVDGITATTLSPGEIPVVVHVHDAVPLDRRAVLSRPELTSTVQEENGTRIVRVTADLENTNLSTTIAAMEKQLAPIVAKLPAGYHVTLGGTIAEQRAAFAEFGTIFAIALALIFAVLVATFDSFRLPLVVLAAIPLTPIGVALALTLTHTTLNVASFMGMLLLIGIVVRNSILLVESANARVREGADPKDAVERAALERLRPILMTTFATLGALAPLAFGLGAGSEMERPLAIAVIGGIITATTLTLAFVPVLYVATVRGRAKPPVEATPEPSP